MGAYAPFIIMPYTLSEIGDVSSGVFSRDGRCFHFMRYHDGAYSIELDNGKTYFVGSNFIKCPPYIGSELDFLAKHFFPDLSKESQDVNLSFLLFGVF